MQEKFRSKNPFFVFYIKSNYINNLVLTSLIEDRGMLNLVKMRMGQLLKGVGYIINAT